MAEPGGNLDRERLIAEVLEPLRAGQQGSYRLFDCRTMALAPGTVPLPQTPIILLEGSYSCHPDLWNYCALHAFVDVEPAEQLRRLAARAPGKAGRFQNQMDPQRGNLFCTFPDPGTVRGEGIITARFVRPCRPIKCCQGDALIPPRKIINGLLCT